MVRLSKAHGVNPSLGVCFICNQEDGSITLFGRLPGDERAPLRAAVSSEPCDKCKAHMQLGVILISVREPKTTEDEKNPYRTGGWAVVKEEALRELIQPPELCEAICRKRIAFVPDDAWDMLGLPRSTPSTAEAG